MQNFLGSMRQKADQVNFEIDKRNRSGAVQRQIDELRRQIGGVINQVGTQAMELHRRGQLPVPALAALCQTIAEHETQIVALQAQIELIRNEVVPASAAYVPNPYPPQMAVCPTCHVPMAAGARFCPNCGQPLAVSAPVLDPGPPCPSCSAPTVKDAAFCNECGFSLMAPPGPISAPTLIEPPSLGVEEPRTSERPPSVSDLFVPAASVPEPPPAAEVSSGEPPRPAESDRPLCPNCGAQQRRAEARFCPVCGQALKPSTVVDTAASAIAEEPAHDPVP